MPEYSEKVKEIIELYDMHFNNEMEITDYFNSKTWTDEELSQIINFTVNHPHAIRSKGLLQNKELADKITSNLGNGEFFG